MIFELMDNRFGKASLLAFCSHVSIRMPAFVPRSDSALHMPLQSGGLALKTAACSAQVIAGMNMEVVFTIQVTCSGAKATASTLQLHASGFFPPGRGVPTVKLLPA